uniref:Uncharacterized protein n=1 Tax=uncultured Planctomycetales bacterium HF0500_40D21 TaxID=710747 RepID=E7C6E6_9BACT|nr:hypothetical protein [uncultured Planctomycetales bacterium HF0500_40D21]
MSQSLAPGGFSRLNHSIPNPHVANLVAVNRPQHRGSSLVTTTIERLGKRQRVVQVGSLEDQGQAGQVVQRAGEGLGLLPDVTVDRQVTESQPTGGGAFDVHPGVSLLVGHHLDQSGPEFGRRVRKCTQHQPHHLQGL